MEQAYRQRKGLPLLTDADIEALKAGQPMPWEEGGAAPACEPARSCGGKFRFLLLHLLPHRRPRHLLRLQEASARKLPNGLRKAGSGASQPSPLSRLGADEKVCPR